MGTLWRGAAVPATPARYDAEIRSWKTPAMALPRRLLIRVAIIVLVGVALLYGGVLLYTQVLNDAPDALDTTDLDAALATTDQTTTSTSTKPAQPSTNSTTTSVTVAPAPDEPGTQPGRWIVDAGSQVGYRVAEVLFGVETEGVGRTDQVNGGITLVDGTVAEVDFTVDVASIVSDDGRRDNQFRGRIMDATNFPTATFVATEPFDIGTDAVEGADVTIDVTGDLTLRGQTRQVVASVTARVESGRIGILGSIPVVFTDFDIVDPSLPGISVEPDGLVEFILVLSPAS
ncbi:MAG: YceI family protein [Ilumatobacteraceae bacterium]